MIRFMFDNYEKMFSITCPKVCSNGDVFQTVPFLLSSELSDCAQIDGAKKRPIRATINATVTCGVMVWFPSRSYSYSALNPFPFLSLSRSRSRHKSFYFSSFCSLPLCKQSYLTFFLLIDIWYNLSLLLLKFYL